MAIKWHRKRWVNLSDLFNGLEAAQSYFGQSGDYPFTWGDCQHSLIYVSRLREQLDDIVDPDTENSEIVLKQCRIAIARIDSLPKNTLVDLEN